MFRCSTVSMRWCNTIERSTKWRDTCLVVISASDVWDVCCSIAHGMRNPMRSSEWWDDPKNHPPSRCSINLYNLQSWYSMPSFLSTDAPYAIDASRTRTVWPNTMSANTFQTSKNHLNVIFANRCLPKSICWTRTSNIGTPIKRIDHINVPLRIVRPGLYCPHCCVSMSRRCTKTRIHVFAMFAPNISNARNRTNDITRSNIRMWINVFNVKSVSIGSSIHIRSPVICDGTRPARRHANTVDGCQRTKWHCERTYGICIQMWTPRSSRRANFHAPFVGNYLPNDKRSRWETAVWIWLACQAVIYI